jgi:hypothetical protein
MMAVPVGLGGLLIFCFCARSLAKEGDSLGYFGLAGLGPIWNWAGSFRQKIGDVN